MHKTLLLSVLMGAAFTQVLTAQETDYKTVFFDYQLPPSLPQYGNYKSYDVAVVTTQPESVRKTMSFDLPYQVKLGNMEQVDSTGDFHIVVLLQRYGGTITSASTATVKISLNTTVYDKYGNVIKTTALNNDAFPVNFGRDLNKDERANQELTRRLIMEKAIEASLGEFSGALYGTKLRPTIKVASLDDVKKKPDLQEFDAQQKALVIATEKGGFAAFKSTAQPYLPYWEKMAAYAGDGDANEVKRAAYHNLALYHIASGDMDKAREYIELYKPIDKTIKEMFGLIKYKNSEECEKLITTLFPAATSADAPAGDKVWGKTQAIDDFKYIIIDGTVKIDTKKDAGTYNGLIKVNKIPVNSFGNIMSLDPENIVATIHTTDANQQPKTIETTVSKIEELKDKNGTSYVTQKFGTAVLGDGSYYAFMKSTYSSPKVTVYRTILPAGSADFVIRKAGDDKGVKSSLFGARKNLEEYLADCAPLAEKMKNGTVDKKASVEKIAELYSSCQ
jgi:hypothetical protein